MQTLQNGTKIIQLSNKRIVALKSHARGQGHQDKIKEQDEVHIFFSKHKSGTICGKSPEAEASSSTSVVDLTLRDENHGYSKIAG